ncbi:hypothetical protein B0T14DRAFT_571759 [Immersiella caudata]|uniref:Uncharacterized protein n=1 Tax=Immersiella caudata TaxID=314043 RepID=A0AA39W4L0_9PEZI|nr:hypothetical protein B0T14DRAFT_571759 [Immersiella caudata]
MSASEQIWPGMQGPRIDKDKAQRRKILSLSFGSKTPWLMGEIAEFEMGLDKDLSFPSTAHKMHDSHSTQVDPSTHETDGFCEGIALRIHRDAILEDPVSVIFPETKPGRMEVLAYFHEYIAMHDDISELGDEAGVSTKLYNPLTPLIVSAQRRSSAYLLKAFEPREFDIYGVKRSRKKMFSKILKEMLSLDPGPASTALSLWAPGLDGPGLDERHLFLRREEDEAEQMCRNLIKESVLDFLETIRGVMERKDVSNDFKIFVDASKFMISGDLVWSVNVPPYHPAVAFIPGQLEWMANGTPSPTIIHHVWIVVHNIYFHPLSNIPGPKLYASSRLPKPWYKNIRGQRWAHLRHLHNIYGDAARIAL